MTAVIKRCVALPDPASAATAIDLDPQLAKLRDVLFERLDIMANALYEHGDDNTAAICASIEASTQRLERQIKLRQSAPINITIALLLAMTMVLLSPQLMRIVFAAIAFAFVSTVVLNDAAYKHCALAMHRLTGANSAKVPELRQPEHTR